MRTIVFGDIHGRRYWKDFVSKYDADKYVFIGDYFDSFDYNSLIQIENFKDIIAFKKSRPDDVVLLIGNHDAHYMGIGAQYSGFQVGARFNIEPLLKENRSLLQYAHSLDSILFTHAGVTKAWCARKNIDLDNIVESINDQHITEFKTAGQDISGDNTISSPIWVRPRSLRFNAVDGWTQVVGHTRQDDLVLDGTNIVLIDTLGKRQALMIEDGVFSVATVEDKIKKPRYL